VKEEAAMKCDGEEGGDDARKRSGKSSIEHE
jgi:hypothetical protein